MKISLRSDELVSDGHASSGSEEDVFANKKGRNKKGAARRRGKQQRTLQCHRETFWTTMTSFQTLQSILCRRKKASPPVTTKLGSRISKLTATRITLHRAATDSRSPNFLAEKPRNLQASSLFWREKWSRSRMRL